MQQIAVSELMRICPAAVISEAVLLREAAELLVVHNLSLLVVQDSDGHIMGVIPEAAVIRQLMQTSNQDELVRHTISTNIDSVRSEACLTTVLHLFRSSCNAIVPVVDVNDVVVGMLYRSDVVGYLLSDAGSTKTKETSSPEQQKPHFMKRPDTLKQRKGLSDQTDGLV